jgi:mannose-6-phosphate isomerase
MPTVPVPESQPDIATITRPWGHFEQFAHNEPVTVSLMHVREGETLSLQAHARRAELWIVLDDGGRVEVDGRVEHPRAGDKVWIPLGARHRLASERGTIRVLEVAFGDWQQGDIHRFDDVYQRPVHEV